MKLASLKQGRDGRLVVVSRDLGRYVKAEGAPTLQAALDNWATILPGLRAQFDHLQSGAIKGEAFDPALCASPLPRAYQWVDGSAYVTHVELVRKARGAEMPQSFWHDPLMYQGGSDSFLAPEEPIALADEAWGIDYEAEIAVITDDVPMGISADAARAHIQLVLLVNDVSLRNLIPPELEKGFGFFQSKPSSAFSPTAVTPDELGAAWDGGRLHLPLRSYVNGALYGQPNAGVDMTFDFGQLIAHAAKTRPLCAGTIVGSGTVANSSANNDESVGSSCLAERRMREKLKTGAITTPFLKFGDEIRIEMCDSTEQNIFGSIRQRVQKCVHS